MEQDPTQASPKRKTDWAILALIAVIAAGLIAYFWVGQASCPESSTRIVVVHEQDTATGDADEAQLAADTLINFFKFASQGKYEQAAELLEPLSEGGEVATSWDDMPGISVEPAPTTHAGILEAYCDTFQTCLAVEALEATKVDANTYKFTVKFMNADGTVYELGPCCGATGDPATEFTYFVKEIDGEWKVITAPLYHP